MGRKSKKIQDSAIEIVDNSNHGTRGFQAFYGRAAQLQGRKDILQNATFNRSYRLSQEVCENVYMDTWIGKKIVELPVSRAMRNGLVLEMDNEEDEESEENTCSRSNGFLYICEGGVGDVDCPSCNGTGLNNERVFDTENFVEFIEHGVIFGEQPFLDLLHCEIVDTEQNGSACV